MIQILQKKTNYLIKDFWMKKLEHQNKNTISIKVPNNSLGMYELPKLIYF